MGRNKYFKQNTLSLIDQLIVLKIAYPEANAYIHRGVLYWNGKLCPSQLSRTYNVKLKYKLKKHPIVTVSGENLKKLDDPNFPHVFNIDLEKWLIEICLYYNEEFNSQMLLADTIIPWTVEWLYYYEIWLATGNWYGGGKHPVSRKIGI